MSDKKPMREAMPTVAGWIDELREVFGADQINPSIKAGMEGQPTFWARENGVEVGTKFEGKGLTLEHIHTGPLSARKD